MSGMNNIEIRALDPANNEAIIMRKVLQDNTPPSLTISDPQQDINTNKHQYLLKGEVTDISYVSVKVDHNGLSYTPLLLNDKFQQLLEFTEEKTYTVSITVTDAAGNTSTAQRKIVYDKTPPTVTAESIPSVIFQDNLILNGTREENSIIQVICEGAIIEQIEYPTSTTWRVSVTNLHTGNNIFNIKAVDLSMNEFTMQIATSVQLFQAGDLNHDYVVDLTDAILVLQVISRMTPSQPIYVDTYINKDGRISIDNAIYVLQKTAGLR